MPRDQTRTPGVGSCSPARSSAPSAPGRAAGGVWRPSGRPRGSRRRTSSCSSPPSPWSSSCASCSSWACASLTSCWTCATSSPRGRPCAACPSAVRLLWLLWCTGQQRLQRQRRQSAMAPQQLRYSGTLYARPEPVLRCRPLACAPLVQLPAPRRGHGGTSTKIPRANRMRDRRQIDVDVNQIVFQSIIVTLAICLEPFRRTGRGAAQSARQIDAAVQPRAHWRSKATVSLR